jgi:hypothetical protein
MQDNKVDGSKHLPVHSAVNSFAGEKNVIVVDSHVYFNCNTFSGFNVCGSVYLGNIRFILIQLDVQYFFS